MAKLKVPSLQHAARIWRPNPDQVCRVLVNLALHPPTLSYEKIYKLVRDMLVFGQSLDQLKQCLKQAERREEVLKDFLEILALVHSHFDGIQPTFTHQVTGRLYPVARGLMIPFNPPLLYGTGGKLIFPWFIFWKSNPLSGENLSLFVTLVHEVLLQDSDLEDAKFEILDFSSPAKGVPRRLKVLDSRDVPLLSEERKLEMLEALVKGYLQAQAEVAEIAKRHKESGEASVDPNQLHFFEPK